LTALVHLIYGTQSAGEYAGFFVLLHGRHCFIFLTVSKIRDPATRIRNLGSITIHFLFFVPVVTGNFVSTIFLIVFQLYRVSFVIKMETFRTRAGSFSEVRKKMLPLMIGLYTGMFLLVIVLPAISGGPEQRWSLVLITLLIFSIVIGFATWSALKRQRRSFESFTLTIDDEKVVREQYNTPTITIYKRDVVRIIRNHNGSFTIVGDNELNAIGIPEQIENYEQLKDNLEQIRRIDIKMSKSLAEKLFVPISLVVALLIATTGITDNANLNVVCSFLIIVIMTSGMVVILVSKNIDKRTKRWSWIFLITIISYLVNIFSLLSN
jgi:hypothetical protein